MKTIAQSESTGRPAHALSVRPDNVFAVVTRHRGKEQVPFESFTLFRFALVPFSFSPAALVWLASVIYPDTLTSPQFFFRLADLAGGNCSQFSQCFVLGVHLLFLLYFFMLALLTPALRQWS